MMTPASLVMVMVEEIDEAVIGRAEHQGLEVDGCVTLVDAAAVSVGSRGDGR